MVDQPAVLITGGSGFIGRNLAEHLIGSFLVVAPSRGELDLLDVDAVDRFFRSTRIISSFIPRRPQGIAMSSRRRISLSGT